MITGRASFLLRLTIACSYLLLINSLQVIRHELVKLCKTWEYSTIRWLRVNDELPRNWDV